eukprot:5473256-Pyramimonas_sp.AAC.1
MARYLLFSNFSTRDELVKTIHGLSWRLAEVVNVKEVERETRLFIAGAAQLAIGVVAHSWAHGLQ